ncbi:MAG TPA: type II secretion system F family protein [Candidatus Nanoarchaeia archaeon]|nr:type II secretion system F family protein [Candidatus Nanoarchaeia archaeon]
MKAFKKIYIVEICISLLAVAGDVYLFWGKRPFWPIAIIVLSLGWLHFWINFFAESRRQKEIELKFVEFARTLVESVKSGVSIPRSIMNLARKDFGALTPYLQKLARQIEWGIPTKKALMTFSTDTDNRVIKRSVSILVEAEQSGGDISDILESVVESVINIKKMREERKASVYSQVVQGYMVYFIFIIIMLILQLWLFPKLGNLSIGGAAPGDFNLNPTFFGLIMIQGLFAGIMIGKFSEGTLKQGILHALILMTLAALIITTVKGSIL